MAKVMFKRVNTHEELEKTKIIDGQIIFTKTGSIYIDFGEERILLNNGLGISIADMIFPVGRGFIDFTDTDYTNYLGFKWERELVGMVGVGLDKNQPEFDTIGKTDGEKTHILTIEEMPEHNPGNLPAKWTDIGITGGGNIWGYSADYEDDPQLLKSIGGNQPHNNMPPYKVVAYWKRVE